MRAITNRNIVRKESEQIIEQKPKRANRTVSNREKREKTNMSTQKVYISEKNPIKMNSKVIKVKTQEFLSARRKLQPLNEIIHEFEVFFGSFKSLIYSIVCMILDLL